MVKVIEVLVVEDEKAIRDMIRFALPVAEFKMTEAADAKEALRLLQSQTPDIMILDWMLPGKSGIEFIKWIREESQYPDLPVVMLTARAEEENRVKGLGVGADDYIIKPFSPLELIARLRAVLRRGPIQSPQDILSFKEIRIDLVKREATIFDKPLQLTRNEFDLLVFFIRHCGRSYSRDMLLSNVWRHGTFVDDRAVDAQIKRLRQRLRPYEYDHYVQTVRGFGYKWSDEGECPRQ